MYLYLIQHGEAKTKEDDPERDLTDRGISAAEAAADFFNRMKPEIHVVWHSGKKRARHTAEIFADRLDIRNRLLEHTGLTPNDDVSQIKTKLENLLNSVVIVGHLPHLARLASLLLTGNEGTAVISFQNSGILCLEREGSNWHVCWMVTPDTLPSC